MVDRERFLRGAAYGVFTFIAAGMPRLLTCAEARAAQAELSVLSPLEQSTLEAFGETLLPGARDAGIAHYVDHQLGTAPEDCLLLLRYLEYHEPFTDFYRGGVAALNASTLHEYGAMFAELSMAQRSALVRTMVTENPPGWRGLPAPLFYFAARSDAVDVVFGTVAGFERLAVPYMPHIEPTSPW